MTHCRVLTSVFRHVFIITQKVDFSFNTYTYFAVPRNQIFFKIISSIVNKHQSDLKARKQIKNQQNNHHVMLFHVYIYLKITIIIYMWFVIILSIKDIKVQWWELIPISNFLSLSNGIRQPTIWTVYTGSSNISPNIYFFNLIHPVCI